MHKSFIDRLFPHPNEALLPQHTQRKPSPSSQPEFSEDLNQSRASSSSRQRQPIRSAPLSASFVHHDDPFLPIERAARALQENIQVFLDVQSSTLGGRINSTGPEETHSTGSLTPTQSSATPTRISTSLRTVPVRQPKRKKITLQGARKGLTKSMDDFARLREEEIRLLEAESELRTEALRQVDEYGEKKTALNSKIESIRREEASQSAASLRSEAGTLGNEIQELEHKILELKVRQRHLLTKADQIESSQDSKASSFQHSLSEIDREVKAFLRRPPVHHAFVYGSAPTSIGMYSLKPERRTLEMAEEQWKSEKDAILQRKPNVEYEQQALVEGKRMWSTALTRINNFEHSLRAQNQLLNQTSATKQPHQGNDAQSSPSEPMQKIMLELQEVVESLEQDLTTAEDRNWNLLVCALAAELEAFYQARGMLQPNHDMENGHANKATDVSGSIHHGLLDEAQNGTVDNDIQRKEEQVLTDSVHSNQSLQDTLAEFGADPRYAVKDENGRKEHKDESEDDDPPPDFLISR